MYAIKCLGQVQTHNPHCDSSCSCFIQWKVRCQQVFFQSSAWSKAMLFLGLFGLQNLFHTSKDQICKHFVEKPIVCNRSDINRLNCTQFFRQHSEKSEFPSFRKMSIMETSINVLKTYSSDTVVAWTETPGSSDMDPFDEHLRTVVIGSAVDREIPQIFPPIKCQRECEIVST